jgi:hypothetical protein
MNTYEKLGEALNVKLTDDFHGRPDLEIGTWQTADGYDLHVMTDDPQHVSWEYDVYYYEPDFNTVIDRIKETADNNSYDGDPAVVWLADFDQYLPEGEVQDYLEELNDKNND